MITPRGVSKLQGALITPWSPGLVPERGEEPLLLAGYKPRPFTLSPEDMRVIEREGLDPDKFLAQKAKDIERGVRAVDVRISTASFRRRAPEPPAFTPVRDPRPISEHLMALPDWWVAYVVLTPVYYWNLIGWLS